MFRHPKYYKELRKLRNKLDQVISSEAGDGERERAERDAAVEQPAEAVADLAAHGRRAAPRERPSSIFKLEGPRE